jgi:membrane protease YdiL (CAAX protease family)
MLSSGRMESGGEHWSLKEQLIAVIGLVLAFGFVLRKAIFGGSGSPAQEAFVTIAAQWITLAVIAFIAFRALKLRAIDMGLRALKLVDWLLIPVTLIVALVAAGIVSRLFPSPAFAEASSLLALPLPTRVLLSVTAGICEEFLFRGYGITVLTCFIGNRWWAGLLSLVAFTLAHASLFGWTTALLVPGVLGLILTLLFLLRRNVVIGMIVHALIDGISLVLAPLAAAKSA